MTRPFEVETFEEFGSRHHHAGCRRRQHERHSDASHARAALAALESRRRSGPVESFDTYEHAELGTRFSGGVQALVDAWARAGLIDGGVFIDTGAFSIMGQRVAAKGIAEWAITVPDAIPLRGAGSPYAGKSMSAGARWHWIAPDPVFRRPGERWTAETLRAALLSGEALALNLGQIVFIAGDLVPSFASLKDPSGVPYHPAPEGTMRGYHNCDPFAWEVLSQLSRFRHRAQVPGVSGGVNVSQFVPDVGHLFALMQPMMASRSGGYERLRASLRSSNRPDWADRLKRDVEIVQRLRGGKWYRELHVLAQTLWLQKTLNNDLILPQAPWLDTGSQMVMRATSSDPFDDLFLQEVLTNGRYFALARANVRHFHPGNWSSFNAELRAALDLVHTHILSRRSPHPIPADAVARLTYGLHFLTDAFSSGHMRQPRELLTRDGNIASKVMHDVDGNLGLTVTNGFQGTRPWRAFGDGQLRGPNEKVGEEVLRRLKKAGKVNAKPDANLEAARAAVSAAMKQLHYHAQHHRGVQNTEHVHRALDAARVTRGGLAGDDRSPEGKPGPDGYDVNAWIKMSVKERLDYLEKHRPRPLPEGPNWDALPENHVPLIEREESIDGPKLKIDGRKLKRGGFRWAKDRSRFDLNRRIKIIFPSDPQVDHDVLDGTKVYQVTINKPDEATWAGDETKLAELLRSMPEDVSD